MSTLKRKDLKFLPIQSNTGVLWHKCVCHLLDAGQSRQMPEWTGCVTCPHLQTAMNKTKLPKLEKKKRPRLHLIRTDLQLFKYLKVHVVNYGLSTV